MSKKSASFKVQIVFLQSRAEPVSIRKDTLIASFILQNFSSFIGKR